jgi:transcriptional regulator with XRE-family HTH domain
VSTDIAAASRTIGDLYLRLGANITTARRDRNLTQTDLASAVGLTRASISNLEAGRQRTPLHITIAIAQALGLDLADLLGEVPPIAAPLPTSFSRLRAPLEAARREIAALLDTLPEATS